LTGQYNNYAAVSSINKKKGDRDKMIQGIKISITPEILRAGGPVAVEATVLGDADEVKRLIASLPEYNYSEVIPRSGDNVFRLNTTVPWEAPSGTFTLDVAAVGEKWNTLYKTTVDISIE